jgi:hypothetical protein
MAVCILAMQRLGVNAYQNKKAPIIKKKKNPVESNANGVPC